MATILYFLSKYSRILVFILLEAIGFAILVGNNETQGGVFRVWVLNTGAGIDEKIAEVRAYFHLQHVNDSLMAENARLRMALPSSVIADTAKPVMQTDTAFRQKFVVLPVNVVNNSTTTGTNVITLDEGTNKGITSHMGVISTAGVVGITRFSSAHFTTAISVLHKDFKVSAQIVENKEVGTVEWDGKNPDLVVLRNIPVHIPIRKGWHVVVSQNSDAFPQGTVIGTIHSAYNNTHDGFYTIYVKLASDIRNLERAYIIKNIVKEEKDKLEQKTHNDAREH